MSSKSSKKKLFKSRLHELKLIRMDTPRSDNYIINHISIATIALVTNSKLNSYFTTTANVVALVLESNANERRKIKRLRAFLYARRKLNCFSFVHQHQVAVR